MDITGFSSRVAGRIRFLAILEWMIRCYRAHKLSISRWWNGWYWHFTQKRNSA